MKTCSKCGVEKSDEEFYFRADHSQNPCKQCVSENRCEYRANNQEKIRVQKRAGYEKNRDQILLKAHERYKNTAPEFRKKYPENSASRRNGRRNRYAQDTPYKITRLLRGRLRAALSGVAHSQKTLELLGCPVVWLEFHLESLFKPGMTWENHGPIWHIDHIKPCAKFDLTDHEQQRICFHWTNLQPLFAKENISKGDTYDG